MRLARWLRLLPLLWLLAGWLALPLPAAAQVGTGCGPATGQGAAPADFRSYCWLNLASYVHSTATSTGGQNFNYLLPDGTRIAFNLKTTLVSGSGAVSPVAVPAWTGGAFGNNGFNGIPGSPVLYSTANQTANFRFDFTAITVTPPTGGTATYSLVVADGEQTNNNPESLRFVTNGNAWVTMAQVPATGSTNYPTLSGANTTDVTLTGNSTGATGAYVFRSDNNPTSLTVYMNTGGGRQGFLIGARYASIAVYSQYAGAGRYLPGDQFNYQVVTDNSVILATQTTAGTAASNTNTAFAAVPTIAASYPFTVQLTGAGSPTAVLTNYSHRLTCTNGNSTSSTALPNNLAASSYRFPNLQFNDAITCTFTSTPLFNSLSGTVYLDRNRNGIQDSSGGSVEQGPSGNLFFVKLVPQTSGSCTGPASAVATPDATSGAYTFTNVTAGTYCVVLDNNTTTTDVTPTLPTGWLATQNASGSVVVTVPLGSPSPVPTNFGVFNGSLLAGTVYLDTGAPSGTANNGVRDGTEAGIGNLTVTASSGATVVATALTLGDGSFSLAIPAGTTNPITVSVIPPSGYQVTGGSAGTTTTAGGSFTRPTVSYSPVTGQSYTGVAFGLVPPPTFAASSAQTALPGSVVFYEHSYVAGTGGQVTFTVSGAAQPATPAWSAALYRDSNCNGNIDNAEPLVLSTLTVTAGQQVCLIAKQFVPAGAPFGAVNNLTLTATFAYTGASPALTNTVLVLNDVTTVGLPNSLNLQKLVRNVTQSGANALTVNAKPGETLEYTLVATNVGSQPLSGLVINDATPSYTTYVSGACPGTLPAGLSACTLTTQPAAGATGALQWNFTGSLSSGATFSVTYRVQLNF